MEDKLIEFVISLDNYAWTKNGDFEYIYRKLIDNSNYCSIYCNIKISKIDPIHNPYLYIDDEFILSDHRLKTKIDEINNHIQSIENSKRISLMKKYIEILEL